jgi:hypothetical protein
MTMTTKQRIIAGILALFGLSMALSPVLVSAQAAGASVNATVTTPAAGVQMSATAMANAKARAGKELDRRLAALESINTRVQAMQKVTDTFKQNLATTVQTQIAAFGALKTKIDADTDGATLKADVQSITESYRVYALVLPQIRIAAAADRAVTISAMMQTLGTKLAARIQAAGNAGADVTVLNTTLNDLAAKISDASTQAQAAVSVSASLAPDQGDKDKMAANKAALATAREDLKTAGKDINDAQKDIASLITGIKKVEATLKVQATSTAAVQ